MPTRRTIDDAISVTLEWLDEALRGDASAVADHSVAEERFADVAACQLLTLIPAELRARSAWSGYGGTAVARRLLDEFYANWNQLEPNAALSLADAALAIAQSSERRTPALLFRAHATRATVLSVQSDFDEAFASLAEAEEYAADTKSHRLHRAILANHRAAVYLLMERWRDALELLGEAREGYEACRDVRHLRELRTFYQVVHFTAGKYDEAIRLGQLGLQDAVGVGNPQLIAMDTGNVGISCLEMGDTEAARRYLSRALHIYRSLGWPRHTANQLALLGRIEIREKGVEGIVMFERACAELDRLELPVESAETRLEMAEELLTLDPQTDVSEICREAYTSAISVGRTVLAERALRLGRNSPAAKPS